MANTAGAPAWTEQDFAHVKRRWNDGGASAGVIARELGRTRNSVCGLIHRFREHFDDRSMMSPALRVTGPSAQTRRASKPARVPPSWTAEEIETAERMWGEWALIREIAEGLGKSYDVVNRYINLNREKFPNRHKPRREGAAMAARPTQPLPFRAEEVVAPVPDHAATFLTVTDRQCRWPLWGKDENPGAEGLCCGAAIEFGLRYCGFHRRASRQTAAEAMAARADTRGATSDRGATLADTRGAAPDRRAALA